MFHSNLHDKRGKVNQKYWRLPKKKKLLHAMKENPGLKDPPPPKVGLRILDNAIEYLRFEQYYWQCWEAEGKKL